MLPLETCACAALQMGERKRQDPSSNTFSILSNKSSDKPVVLSHFMQRVREGMKLLPAAVISGALNGPAK